MPYSSVNGIFQKKTTNLQPTSNGRQKANCAPHSSPKHIIAPNVVITSSILMMKYICEFAFSSSLSAGLIRCYWFNGMVFSVSKSFTNFLFFLVHLYTQIKYTTIWLQNSINCLKAHFKWVNCHEIHFKKFAASIKLYAKHSLSALYKSFFSHVALLLLFRWFHLTKSAYQMEYQNKRWSLLLIFVHLIWFRWKHEMSKNLLRHGIAYTRRRISSYTMYIKCT